MIVDDDVNVDSELGIQEEVVVTSEISCKITKAQHQSTMELNPSVDMKYMLPDFASNPPSFDYISLEYEGHGVVDDIHDPMLSSTLSFLFKPMNMVDFMETDVYEDFGNYQEFASEEDFKILFPSMF